MCSVLVGGPVLWLKRPDRETDLAPLSGADVNLFKRHIKSHLPYAGIIR